MEIIVQKVNFVNGVENAEKLAQDSILLYPAFCPEDREENEFEAPSGLASHISLMKVERLMESTMHACFLERVAESKNLTDDVRDYLALTLAYISKNSFDPPFEDALRSVFFNFGKNPPGNQAELYAEFGIHPSSMRQKLGGATLRAEPFYDFCRPLPFPERVFVLNMLRSYFPSTDFCFSPRTESVPRDALRTLASSLPLMVFNELLTKADPLTRRALLVAREGARVQLPEPTAEGAIGPSLPRSFYAYLEEFSKASNFSAYLRDEIGFRDDARQASYIILHEGFYSSRNTWRNWQSRWMQAYDAAREEKAAFSIPQTSKISRCALLALLVRGAADFAEADLFMSTCGYSVFPTQTLSKEERDLIRDVNSFFCQDRDYRNDMTVQDSLVARLRALQKSHRH